MGGLNRTFKRTDSTKNKIRLGDSQMNKSAYILFLFILLALTIPTGSSAEEEVQWDRSVLPIAPKPFQGHVGLRESESTLDFPPEVKAPEGAPNILLIMPDDVGFGAPSAFGGPVPTPAIERIAQAGMWYGKNHNVPDWHSSQAGPFDLWPTGLGFEQFFGFIGGDTSQFTDWDLSDLTRFHITFGAAAPDLSDADSSS